VKSTLSPYGDKQLLDTSNIINDYVSDKYGTNSFIPSSPIIIYESFSSFKYTLGLRLITIS